MRDPKQNMIRSTRKRRTKRTARFLRRAILASALVATVTSSSQAQEAQTELRFVTPLPIQQVANHEIHQNPFCEPKLRAIPGHNVHLASGNDESPNIRLKATGAAIGLKPISSSKPSSVRPAAVRPGGLKIEAVRPPAIKINQLIESQHIENTDLVDAGVTPMANERLEELELTRRGQGLAPAVRLAPPSMAVDVGVVQRQQVEPLAMRTEQVAATESKPARTVMRLNPVSNPPVVEAAKSILVAPSATTSAVTSPSPLAKVEPSQEPMIPAVPVAVPVETASVAPATAPIAKAATPPAVQALPDPAAQHPTANRSTEPSTIPAAPTAEAVDSQAASNNISATKPIETSDAPAGTPEVVAEVEREPLGPVFFSMSDSSADKPTKPEPESLSDKGSSDSAAEKGLSPVVVPVPSASEPIVELAEPVGLQPVPSRLTALEPPEKIREITKPNVIYRAEPAVSQRKDLSATLSSKRYRPPVAVDAPPVAITQPVLRKPPTVKPALQNPIIAAMPDNTAQRHNTSRSQPSLTKLHMTRAQVRSLTIGGHVRRINVSNKNVCQAIATGPNQVKLIGTGYGVTRLVVWADTTSRSPTRVRTFEIHVEDAVRSPGTTMDNKTETLNQSIAKAFPNSNVVVEVFQDRLVVAGECDNEEQAKKIIRMVRKTCLVPVRDELKVR